MYNDARGTLRNARGKSVSNAWRGQFHMRGFYNLLPADTPKELGNVIKHIISGRQTTAVIHQYDSQRVGLKCLGHASFSIEHIQRWYCSMGFYLCDCMGIVRHGIIGIAIYGTTFRQNYLDFSHEIIAWCR